MHYSLIKALICLHLNLLNLPVNSLALVWNCRFWLNLWQPSQLLVYVEEKMGQVYISLLICGHLSSCKGAVLHNLQFDISVSDTGDKYTNEPWIWGEEQNEVTSLDG